MFAWRTDERGCLGDYRSLRQPDTSVNRAADACWCARVCSLIRPFQGQERLALRVPSRGWFGHKGERAVGGFAFASAHVPRSGRTTRGARDHLPAHVSAPQRGRDRLHLRSHRSGADRLGRTFRTGLLRASCGIEVMDRCRLHPPIGRWRRERLSDGNCLIRRRTSRFFVAAAPRMMRARVALKASWHSGLYATLPVRVVTRS